MCVVYEKFIARATGCYDTGESSPPKHHKYIYMRAASVLHILDIDCLARVRREIFVGAADMTKYMVAKIRGRRSIVVYTRMRLPFW